MNRFQKSCVLFSALVIIFAFAWSQAYPQDNTLIARDNGQYAGSPLKPWFDSLYDHAGRACCSQADGKELDDPDWETRDGHFRVYIDGAWMDVPDEAVLHEPNRAGRTMVWLVQITNGPRVVRCFIPGQMS